MNKGACEVQCSLRCSPLCTMSQACIASVRKAWHACVLDGRGPLCLCVGPVQSAWSSLCIPLALLQAASAAKKGVSAEEKERLKASPGKVGGSVTRSVQHCWEDSCGDKVQQGGHEPEGTAGPGGV